MIWNNNVLSNPLISELISPSAINFRKVRKVFMKENNMLKGSDHYTFKSLVETNKNLGGWVEAKLSKHTLLEIILPHHVHREIELIPEEGMTVEQTFDRLKKIEEKYSKECEICYNTINHFRNKKIGHLFLSSEKPNNFPNYVSMENIPGHLIHLDGLHRSLSILHSGKIDNYSPINCFIAINSNSI